MWRLPVIEVSTPEDALRLFRVIAEQVGRTRPLVLKRYDPKPKRQGSRGLYVLEGLPGVGPALAAHMLARFGSVERVPGCPRYTGPRCRTVAPMGRRPTGRTRIT